jgi:DNA-binding NtrC family response regulator
MKRILVIDESEVIRETLALILGREFAVIKRPPSSSSGFSLADANEEVDLLILGVAPRWQAQTTSFVRFASQLPFAVLFLVDSKATARWLADREQITCLTKPFNPYELQEKVAHLLAWRDARAGTREIQQRTDDQNHAWHLEHPFVSRSVATLAQRFGMTRLPILVFGEIGCGQSQVAHAIYRAPKDHGLRFTIDAPMVTAASLHDKTVEMTVAGDEETAPSTLIVENLDKADARAQSALAAFLEQKDERFAHVRLLATATADLLDRVYRGEFLETVYYGLATLTLKLAPLRERREDIAALAGGFAHIYGRRLGLGECAFSDAANARLADYLWFGNLREMETVIARTLALHRKARIDATDLVFDFGAAVQISEEQTGDFAEFIPRESRAASERIQAPTEERNGTSLPNSNGYGKVPDLNVVIHELAHELKNPMVTIKTFAQLLGDRYDDENFRARFQEVVGGDIERMDDLLEVMIEFADFTAPRRTKVVLAEKLRRVVEEVGAECAKRQTRVEWKGTDSTCEINADESQLAYILKNVLLAILAQTKMGSEIEVAMGGDGATTIAYLREGARVASITHYLSDPSSGRSNETLLPLRILLAKQLLERNGGGLAIDQSDSDKETVRMEFPLG